MRRIVHALGAGVLVLALAGCWPAPGQGPDRTGYNPFETKIAPGNVATLTEQWSVNPGSGVTAPITSGGAVYVTADGPGGENGQIVEVDAYDVRTGQQIFSTPVADFAVPVTYGDPWMVGDDIVTGWYYGRRMPVVYVHTGAAVDSRTGTLTGAVGIGPTETVRGDVVVSSTTEPAGPALDTRSFAVTHLDDPSLSWTATFQYFDFFGTPQGGIGGGMTLGADRLYQAGGGADSTAPGQGSYGNGVRAFPVGNGQAGCGPAGRNLACPLWFTPLAGALTAPPVIAPDQSTVYVVANVTSGSVVNGTLHALDAATGAIRWTASLGVAGRTPALADGTLYVPTSDGRLLVFAAGGCGAATCGPSWEASTGTGSGIGQPAVAGGLVFTGSGDGTVHAFTAAGCGSASCPPLWSASASTTVSVVALAVSNGRLFVRTGDGTLTTYGLP